MDESPIFIAENIVPLCAPTGPAFDSGFPLTNATDNFHFTFAKLSSAGWIAVLLHPVVTPSINCAVVDCEFVDAAGFIRVYDFISPSTYLYKGEVSGITKGANLITFESFVATGAILVQIESAINPKIIRHLWVGVQLPVKAPVAPFDPEKVMQPKNQFFARSGVMTKQSPIYTKKLLEMEINNISGTDYTNLLALYKKSFLKGLPFWYFLKPTSQPKMGYLYEWDQDEFDLSYLKDGTHRRCSIRAIADYSPDRTTATL